jgi:hypothetical protein
MRSLVIDVRLLPSGPKRVATKSAENGESFETEKVVRLRKKKPEKAERGNAVSSIGASRR